MRSFYATSLAAASLLFAGVSAQAQENYFGQPSVLPSQVSMTSYYGQNSPTLASRTPTSEALPPAPTEGSESHGEGIYDEAMTSDWSGCASCCNTCCRGGGWYGSVTGLYMTRDDSNRFTLTCGGADDANRVLDTRSADWDWYGGFDVRIGRKFNCCRNGIEVVYSGLFPGEESSTVYGDDVDGGLKGAQDWFRIQYNDEFANFWVDGATAHRVTKDFDFHNIEVNFLRFQSNCCSRWSWSWLAGVRFFKFDEDLVFASDLSDGDFAGDIDEIYELIDVENNLIGFQIGGTSRYCVSDRFALEFGSKLGVYGNHMRQRTFIGGAAGPALVNNIFSSEFGREIDIASNTNGISFLGELNAGANYRLTRHLSARFGYRAMAVTGVTLASHQLLTHPDAVQEMELIDSNGSLILHGGYAGIEFAW